jgi:peroxiredoxin
MKTGQKLIYAMFVALLATSLVLTHPVRVLADEMARIAASAEDVQPIRSGDMAPGFTVRTVDDEPFIFDPENLAAPTILIIFRGGWCPYCNMHLSELRHVVPELEAQGIDVLFLSGDRPEMLYASLKRETQEAIDGLGYTILSDANIEAATALGIAFRVADSTIQGRLDSGKDIGGSSMMNFHALPVPAVFKVRLPADDLRAAAAVLTD